MKPDASIAADMANSATPSSVTNIARTQPIPMIETISPQPTVVRIVTLHHIAARMLVNTPGCASCSITQIRWEMISKATN